MTTSKKNLRPNRWPILEVKSKGTYGEVLAKIFASKQIENQEIPLHPLQMFHPYPARMHPLVPQGILEKIILPEMERRGEKPGKEWLLDPFCGSGTVLLEAMKRGIPSMGNDLSPIAHLLSQAKTKILKPDKAKEWLIATENLLDKARATKKTNYDSQYNWLRQYYLPHIFVRAVTLQNLIREHKDQELKDLWQIVFSAIAIKFSDRVSDVHVDKKAEKKFSGDFFYQFFGKKMQELIESKLEWQSHGTIPMCKIFQRDFRDLTPSNKIRWIITSPPYPGVFDYSMQQNLRSRWLGLDMREFRRRELCPRRERQGEEEIVSWEKELMKPLVRFSSGPLDIFLILGDYWQDYERQNPVQKIFSMASSLGIQEKGYCSIRRGKFHNTDIAKWEYLVWYNKQ